MLIEISRVGASLFSGGAVCVYVLIVLYPEFAVYLCWIIDSQPVFNYPSDCLLVFRTRRCTLCRLLSPH